MAKYRTGNVLGGVVDLELLSRGVWGRDGFLTGSEGAVTPGTGLQVNVAAITVGGVMMNGAKNTGAYAGSTVNLDAADPTNPRRDIIYYDGASTVTKLSGTPAANPALPTTAFTPASMVILAEVYVGAGVSSLVAGDITDKRQILPNYPRVLYTNANEYTTTSLTAADLVTTTSLNILAAQPFTIMAAVRKSGGAAAAAGVGLKFNSTVVNEAVTSGGQPVWLSNSTDQVQSGGFIFRGYPRAASPYRPGGSIDYQWTSSTTSTRAVTSVAYGSGNIADATIDTITFRGISGNAAVTLGITNLIVIQDAY